MKWRQFCAELLACSDELGVRARRDVRRAARRDRAHPADPGERHGHRARPRGPAAARAGDLRGADRDRRGAQRRLRPARHAGGVVLGRRPPLPAAAAVPQGDAGAAAARSRTCSRSPSRSATCPRRAAPGSAAWPSSPRRTRTSPSTSAASRRARTPPTSPRPAARRSPASSSATSSAADRHRATLSVAGRLHERLIAEARRRRASGSTGASASTLPGGLAGSPDVPSARAPRRRATRSARGASRSSASAVEHAGDDVVGRGAGARPRRRAPARRAAPRRRRGRRRSTSSRCGSGARAAAGGSPSGRAPCSRRRGDEHEVALGLRHLLAVEPDHPGVHVGAREAVLGVDDLGLGGAHLVVREDQVAAAALHVDGAERGARGGRGRSPSTRRASRAGRRRRASPTPAHRAAGRARAGSRAGPSCRAGRGRPRARRRARASARASSRSPRRTPGRGSPRSRGRRSDVVDAARGPAAARSSARSAGSPRRRRRRRRAGRTRSASMSVRNSSVSRSASSHPVLAGGLRALQQRVVDVGDVLHVAHVVPRACATPG